MAWNIPQPIKVGDFSRRIRGNAIFAMARPNPHTRPAKPHPLVLPRFFDSSSGGFFDTHMAQDKPTRIEYLDSVRGLASLMVVLYHFVGWQFQGRPEWIHGLSIVFNGSDAVSLFFVLSGFVLTYKYFRQDKSLPLQIDYPKYLIGRIFRLYPAFLVTLLVSFLWVNRQQMDGNLLFDVFLKNKRQFWEEAVLYRNSFPLVGQAWTLAVEMTVSVLVPLFALFLWHNPRHFPYLMIVWLPMGIFFSQFGFHFMLGMLLSYHFDAVRNYDLKKAKWYPYRYLLYLLIGVLFSYRHLSALKPLGPTFVYFTETFLGVNAFTYSGIASFFLLAKIVHSPRLQRVLEVGPLLFLGRISYGLYLVHWAVLFYWLNGHRSFFETWAGQQAWLLMLSVFLAVSVLLSTLLYYGVEKPFISFGKKMAAKAGNR